MASTGTRAGPVRSRSRRAAATGCPAPSCCCRPPPTVCSASTRAGPTQWGTPADDGVSPARGGCVMRARLILSGLVMAGLLVAAVPAAAAPPPPSDEHVSQLAKRKDGPYVRFLGIHLGEGDSKLVHLRVRSITGDKESATLTYANVAMQWKVKFFNTNGDNITDSVKSEGF